MKKRDLAKALSIVGVTSGTAIWSKPIIDAVSLPAHATTSCTTVEIPSSTQVNVGDFSGVDLTFWLCTPGTYLNSGGVSLTVFVESGVTINSEAGLTDTFYLKSGSTLNFVGGANSHTVYLEPGATVTGFDGDNNITFIETCISFDITNAPACS